MLILAMPSLIASCSCSSATPFAPPSVAPYLVAFSTIHCGTLDAPWRTSGIPTFSLMIFRLF